MMGTGAGKPGGGTFVRIGRTFVGRSGAIGALAGKPGRIGGRGGAGAIGRADSEGIVLAGVEELFLCDFRDDVSMLTSMCVEA